MARDPLFDDERAPINTEYLGIPKRRVREVEEILAVRPDGLIKRGTKTEVRDDDEA